MIDLSFFPCVYIQFVLVEYSKNCSYRGKHFIFLNRDKVELLSVPKIRHTRCPAIGINSPGRSRRECDQCGIAKTLKIQIDA